MLVAFNEEESQTGGADSPRSAMDQQLLTNASTPSSNEFHSSVSELQSVMPRQLLHSLKMPVYEDDEEYCERCSIEQSPLVPLFDSTLHNAPELRQGPPRTSNPTTSPSSRRRSNEMRTSSDPLGTLIGEDNESPVRRLSRTRSGRRSPRQRSKNNLDGSLEMIPSPGAALSVHLADEARQIRANKLTSRLFGNRSGSTPPHLSLSSSRSYSQSLAVEQSSSIYGVPHHIELSFRKRETSLPLSRSSGNLLDPIVIVHHAEDSVDDNDSVSTMSMRSTNNSDGVILDDEDFDDLEQFLADPLHEGLLDSALAWTIKVVNQTVVSPDQPLSLRLIRNDKREAVTLLENEAVSYVEKLINTDDPVFFFALDYTLVSVESSQAALDYLQTVITNKHLAFVEPVTTAITANGDASATKIEVVAASGGRILDLGIIEAAVKEMQLERDGPPTASTLVLTPTAQAAKARRHRWVNRIRHRLTLGRRAKSD